MQEIDKLRENLKVTRIDHLSIVAAFCRRIGLMETINRVVPTQMDVDVGTIVQAMVSKRSRGAVRCTVWPIFSSTRILSFELAGISQTRCSMIRA